MSFFIQPIWHTRVYKIINIKIKIKNKYSYFISSTDCPDEKLFAYVINKRHLGVKLGVCLKIGPNRCVSFDIFLIIDLGDAPV